jgi:hypothetical protein
LVVEWAWIIFTVTTTITTYITIITICIISEQLRQDVTILYQPVDLSLRL